MRHKKTKKQLKNYIMNNRKLLTVYAILNIIVVVVLGYLWNVTGKLMGYALTSVEAWFVFVIICLLIFGLQRLAHRKNGEFTLSECFMTMGGAFIPYFAIFIIFMGSSTGLTDKCIINTCVQKIVHIKSYYTERTEEHCTGSGKDEVCHTETYCDVYHGPSWSICTKTGHTISISSSQYKAIKERFGTSERQTASSQIGQCSGDGRQFEIAWSGTAATRIPCSYETSYINYVKATESIYKTESQQSFKVCPYPKIQDTQFGSIGITRVMGDNLFNLKWAVTVDSLLDQELTWLGDKRQCNIFVYLTKNPQSFYGSLKEKWINGKKNDIVIIIGGKIGNPDWVRVMNWSETSNFEINLRDNILNNSSLIDPFKFVKVVVSTIDSPTCGFERKPMEKFRYLLSEIHLQWWAWVLVFALLAIILTPLVMYMFTNETTE
ncbi:MAG: exosortase/archaeosortase family protein [Candidatus Absconditabacterales bacterium]